MSAEMTTISVVSSSLAPASVSYTSGLRWPQMKRSKSLISGESAIQASGLPPSIQLPRYVEGRWLSTAIEKCTDASSYLDHTFWCLVADTTCSKFERSGKFTYMHVSPKPRIRLMIHSYCPPISYSL
ncbi:hypothetical protein TNCV_2118121 [Trichonephila clavipes]|nr:hypothetical protein TNCV_2118121 [Trichonephila clavipes]